MESDYYEYLNYQDSLDTKQECRECGKEILSDDEYYCSQRCFLTSLY